MTPILALVLGDKRGGEQIIRTQKSEHRTKMIYRHVTKYHIDTSTVRNVVSELQSLLRNVLAWYGTLVRTFKQRTKVS